MTSPDPGRPSETFASIRFAGESLSPLAVSSFIGLRPTIAYAKGDPFVVGERKLQQQRRFGLWMFSTEHLVFSSNFSHHELALYLCLLPPTLKRATSLRAFVERERLAMTVSLYWYGSIGSEMPQVSGALTDFVGVAGGTIETDFEIETADDYVT